MNSRELRQAAFDYAETAKQQLGIPNDLAQTPQLVSHYLFPNLSEDERRFLSDLIQAQFLFSTWVNNFVYEGDKSEEERKAREHEHDFMRLTRDPLLQHIKDKLTPAQLEVLAPFETTEILPPPEERK